MAEYIDREKAIDLFYPVDPENDGSDGCTVVYQSGNYSSAEIESMLSELPPADVAPVRHGWWIEHDSDWGDTLYVCSQCLAEFASVDGTPLDNHIRYCPNCGAKMDG